MEQLRVCMHKAAVSNIFELGIKIPKPYKICRRKSIRKIIWCSKGFGLIDGKSLFDSMVNYGIKHGLRGGHILFPKEPVGISQIEKRCSIIIYKVSEIGVCFNKPSFIDFQISFIFHTLYFSCFIMQARVALVGAYGYITPFPSLG